MRISDWSSDVCSSDLTRRCFFAALADIADHREKQRLVCEVDRAERDFERESRSVAPTANEFLDLAVTFFPVCLQTTQEGFDLPAIGHHFEKRSAIAAKKRFRREVEHQRRGRLKTPGPTAGVHDDHPLIGAR